MKWTKKQKQEKLIRFHTRFRRQTFSEIQELEKETGKCKAEIIRKLVREGIQAIRVEEVAEK